MTNSNKCLLKYAACDSANQMHSYTFATYNRLMHQAQNTAKKYGVNGQINVHLKSDSSDNNLTEEYLRNILEPSHDESQ